MEISGTCGVCGKNFQIQNNWTAWARKYCSYECWKRSEYYSKNAAFLSWIIEGMKEADKKYLLDLIVTDFEIIDDWASDNGGEYNDRR